VIGLAQQVGHALHRRRQPLAVAGEPCCPVDDGADHGPLERQQAVAPG
jgi:hypothetical protein